MIGAIIGDIVGSVYEFNNIKTKEFPFLTVCNSYTDDSLMTIAVGSALMKAKEPDDLPGMFVREMRRVARLYPCPMGGYGGRFYHWLHSADPKPYYSYGNGSAMRVSPCGEVAATLEEALALTKASAEVTHDHPDGIAGAQAAAAAVFLARAGRSREDIRRYVQENFYSLDMTVDGLRPGYTFDVSCKGSVPPAIVAFLESTDFEDAIRNAVSLGGDSDTIAAITGAVAWAYYARRGMTERMLEIRGQAMSRLTGELKDIVQAFESRIKPV